MPVVQKPSRFDGQDHYLLAPARFAEGSGRLELAEAVASASNPLTARVMVNRIWQHHFGAGLVGTPSNFGLPTIAMLVVVSNSVRKPGQLPSP